jgi:hypothetical protein
MILAMNEQSTVKNFWHKLGGYYLIPHELLHVLAYRMISKPYHYQWGDYRVSSPASLSRGELLFVLLLPVGVCWVVGLFLHSLWLILVLSEWMPLERYILEGPRWHHVFSVIASLFILYSGTGYKDIRVVLRILFRENKPYRSGL